MNYYKKYLTQKHLTIVSFFQEHGFGKNMPILSYFSYLRPIDRVIILEKLFELGVKNDYIIDKLLLAYVKIGKIEYAQEVISYAQLAGKTQLFCWALEQKLDIGIPEETTDEFKKIRFTNFLKNTEEVDEIQFLSILLDFLNTNNHTKIIPTKKYIAFEINENFPVFPSKNHDTDKDYTYFQLDTHIEKNKIINESSVYFDRFPQMLNFNMELFSVGEINFGNRKENILLFKPWYIFETPQRFLVNFPSFIEDFIFILPYQTLPYLIAKSIMNRKISFDDLKSMEVIKGMNSDFFKHIFTNLVPLAMSDLPNEDVILINTMLSKSDNVIMYSEYSSKIDTEYLKSFYQ